MEISDAISNENLQTQLHDIKYMERCLSLAVIAQGFVAPNPMVGAVLVYEDQIISEGYHRRYGEPHAEPNAIHAVEDKSLLKKATLYVNLEPCSHFGKTPPCANLIVQSGIPKVVVGTLDPNPKVAGRGVKILQDAGIEVKVGVLEEECRELNKRFFVYQEQKRPYIFLKWAQTKDGFIDRIRTSISEKPLSISNETTRQLTHKMRSDSHAILVSTNTVLLDNPSLTVRNWTGKNPIRIALDRKGIIPEDFNLKNEMVPTIIFTQHPKPSRNNLEYVQHDFSENSLETIINKIYKKGIHSVLVEGGAKLLTSFINSGFGIEANIEISNQIIYEGIEAPILNQIPDDKKEIDGHQWLHYSNPQPFII